MRELPQEAPPRFEVRVLPNPAEVARAAAEELVDAAQDAISNRGVFRVALSGGSTPRALFQTLASRPFRGRIDWNKSRVFFVDERCVPPAHERSNYRMAKEHLLGPLRIPEASVFRMRGEDDPRRSAREYEQVLSREFGGRTPRFDFVQLGVGADGHTASLFPGTRVLAELAKAVAAAYVAEQREWRITLTLPVLNAARRVVFVAVGPEKRAVVAAILRRKRGSASLPASLVKPKRGSLIWILDAAAAADL
ncbi:MAG: 6-phosphogluconolactonase [Acidobacteriota bacterium]|nr:6-phosphogluconolactonase [Acidobacteriota bacterium]